MLACPLHGVCNWRGVFCVSDHRRLDAVSFKKPLLRIEFYGSSQPHRLNLNQPANLIYQEAEALSSRAA